jgi:hypothetical protein
MCRVSTLPGYTATFKILTGLTLDLSALTTRSPAYKITGIARYIQVCYAKEDNVIEIVTLIKNIINFHKKDLCDYRLLVPLVSKIEKVSMDNE